MDCFVVRVYRHITGTEGESDEIAGLIERVGQRDSSRPFSSYQSLISALRQDCESKLSDSADAESGDRETVPALRVVQTDQPG